MSERISNVAGCEGCLRSTKVLCCRLARRSLKMRNRLCRRSTDRMIWKSNGQLHGSQLMAIDDGQLRVPGSLSSRTKPRRIWGSTFAVTALPQPARNASLVLAPLDTFTFYIAILQTLTRLPSYATFVCLNTLPTFPSPRPNRIRRWQPPRLENHML